MAFEEIGDDAHRAERSLVDAAVRGNGLAFRRLVEPHLGMLFRIAQRVSGDRGLAEDAVQETLVLSFERLRQGAYSHDVPFKAFMAAVAARASHTLVRAERRRKGRERRAHDPDAPASPEDELRGVHAARRVQEALASMPGKRREAALLRLDAGLSYAEIAAALDSTEGSARVMVHAALKELREQLGDLLE